MRPLLLLLLSVLALYANPTVTVSIVPQAYFVTKIAGNTVDVNIMVSPGNSPATYEPRPKQMIALDKSDAYFAIGVPFENTWLPKFTQSYPNLPIVFTQQGIERRKMKGHHHHEEEHHDEHDHDKEKHAQDDDTMLDPHIWVDPLHVKIISTTIAHKLISLYPEHQAMYQTNLQNFLAELDALHLMIQQKLANITKKKFMVYHPSWGYFAQRYGLEQEAIELEGKEPKPAMLTKLIQEAKEENIHLLIVQPQFSQKSAKVIADAINGKVISIDHLSFQWKTEMLKMADLFAAALK